MAKSQQRRGFFLQVQLMFMRDRRTKLGTEFLFFEKNLASKIEGSTCPHTIFSRITTLTQILSENLQDDSILHPFVTGLPWLLATHSKLTQLQNRISFTSTQYTCNNYYISTMAVKLVRRRSFRKGSSKNQNQDLSLKRSSSNASNKSSNAEPVLLYKEPVAAETRDERNSNPMGRLFDDASSVISGAVAEAASMANDVQMIIAADVDDVSTLGGDAAEERSVVGKPRSETMHVKDQDALAILIKELGPKEKKMVILGREYIKAREDVIETRQQIQDLSEKIQFKSIVKNERVATRQPTRQPTREGSAVDIISAAYSSIEQAATSAIFPHGAE